MDMFGGVMDQPRVDLHGLAHITGGGLPGKLGRVLKVTGLGADINYPLEPSELMIICQTLGDVSDREAYKTWNMGQGMVAITDDPDAVISVAKEHGIDACIIGEVSPEQGIRIASKGCQTPEEILTFTDYLRD